MRNTPPSAAQPSFGPATAAAPATAAPCRKWRREKFFPIIVVSLVGCASTGGFLALTVGWYRPARRQLSAKSSRAGLPASRWAPDREQATGDYRRSGRRAIGR